MNLFKKASPVGGTGQDGVGDKHETPWILAGRRYDDTYLRLAAQVVNWRRIAFAAIVLAAMAVAGVIYIGAQSKFVPLVIEVDKLGQTLAVRALTGDDAVADSNRLVYREMFDLIENLRAVTTDRVANNSRLAKGYARLSGSARTYVRSELRKAPANDVGAVKTVQVKVKTALKLAGKSWQIDWEEHSFNLQGEETGVELWRATLQYDLTPSGEEQEIRTNPIGFMVPELSWQKVI